MAHVLLAVNDPISDPRARARLGGLVRAGHEPLVVSVGARVGEEIPGIAGTSIRVVRLRDGPFARGGRAAALAGRMLPSALSRRLTEARVASVIEDGAVLHVLDPRALPLAEAVARRVRGVVLADPRHTIARDIDAGWRATEEPGRSGRGLTGGPTRHLPSDTEVWHPEPERHRGRRIALCVRRSERTPGRYLEAALRRAGVEVLPLQERIDAARLPEDLDAVVVVESPLPGPQVVGDLSDVPVLFWVHHGEHHLDLNARLADRYGADVVLLAHSWHLAHRFRCRVERFPFAVAPELGGSSTPPSARPIDVAMVGSGLDAKAVGDAYDARRALVENLRNRLGVDRVATASGISPEEVVALYGRARVVPNEGGRRHRPITMRVFEAVGAGAVLASEPVPGLDQLLEPGREYLPVGDMPVEDVAEALDDPDGLDAIASAATERWRARHTYDHRVDELLSLVDGLRGEALVRGHSPLPAPTSPLGTVIDADPEVQRIATTAPDLAEDLPDREVWPLDRARLGRGTYEAVAVDRPVEDADRLVAAAWRYVYDTTGKLHDAVLRLHPRATHSTREACDVAVHRYDLHPPSYRV